MNFDAHAQVYGTQAVYLIKLIRGWGGNIEGWFFNGLRREAVSYARRAAHYALMQCDCSGGHPVTGQHEPFCNLA